MANEDLDRLERHEELLQKKEERLHRAHERRMEQEPEHKKGGFGSAVGEVGSFLGEHKLIIFGGAAVIIGGIVVLQLINGYNNSNASAGAANQAPNYAASGIMTSDIATQLDTMNQELSALAQAQSSGSSAAPSSSFQFPSALQGMKIWQGTGTGAPLLYSQWGPLPGRQGQENLAALFPTGTQFQVTGNNPSTGGGQLSYLLPGQTTWQIAPVTLYESQPQTNLNYVSQGLRSIGYSYYNA